MRCEGCISLRHIPATGILARRFELRICEDSWTQLIAVRPAVVQAFADDVHGVRRAVVRKRCEHLRLAHGSVVACMVTIAYEAVRERNVNPVLAALVRVKADAVRVMKLR